MKKIIPLAALLFSASYCATAQTSYTAQAKAIVAKMMLEEKAVIVAGMGMNIPGLSTGGGVG